MGIGSGESEAEWDYVRVQKKIMCEEMVRDFKLHVCVAMI